MRKGADLVMLSQFEHSSATTQTAASHRNPNDSPKTKQDAEPFLDLLHDPSLLPIRSVRAGCGRVGRPGVAANARAQRDGRGLAGGEAKSSCELSDPRLANGQGRRQGNDDDEPEPEDDQGAEEHQGPEEDQGAEEHQGPEDVQGADDEVTRQGRQGNGWERNETRVSCELAIQR